ncbi:MAG: response regulator, partial [Arenicella sp.]|nr:response regulator [Arenicella sp.]
GGEIEVESKVGEGTSFIMRLPVHYRQNEVAAAVPSEIDDSPDNNARKIMVVDDDPVARDLLKRHLEKDGYNVKTLADGAEVVSLAKQWQPDIITLDILMANIDGWTVLSNVKNDESISHIPVIMVSIVDEKKMVTPWVPLITYPNLYSNVR